MAYDEVYIEEQMSDSLVDEKAKYRQILLMILQNMQFLARQGIVFRGDDGEGSFDQLMNHKLDFKKKRNK